jgi:hypothetical protein
MHHAGSCIGTSHRIAGSIFIHQFMVVIDGVVVETRDGVSIKVPMRRLVVDGCEEDVQGHQRAVSREIRTNVANNCTGWSEH